jgi:hypothetical protein
MSALIEQPRKRGRGRPPKDEQSNEATIKVERDIAGMARSLAARRGMSVADAVSPVIRAAITKAFLDMLREDESAS